MKTCKNPYSKKIGLNLANLFIIKISKNDVSLLDLVFRPNEREAIGRRILIIIYVLEGYTQESIVKSMGCGFNTITPIIHSIQNYSGDKKLLLQNLRELYYSQFPKKVSRMYSPRSLVGTSRMLGLSKEPLQDRDRKVKLL